LQLDVVKALQKKLVSIDDKTILDKKDYSFLNTTKEKSDVDAFFHFLKTGRNPWWDSEEDVEDPSFIETLISNKKFKNEFFQLIRNSNVRKRLIYQFSDETIITILNEKKSNVPLPKTLEKQKQREHFWESILKFQIHKNKKLLTEELNKLYYSTRIDSIQKDVSKFIKKHSKLKDVIKKNVLQKENKLLEINRLQTSIEKVFIKVITKQLKLALETNKTLELSLETIEKYLDDTFKKYVDYKVVEESITQIVKQLVEFFHEKSNRFRSEIQSFTDELVKENITLVADKSLKDFEISQDQIFEYFEKEKESIQETTNEIEDSALYINNAGLVLLHPYIKILFAALNLLDDEGAIAQEKMELAIHLLHYLATKEEKPKEGSLIFEKFLCGYPLDKPIRKHIKLPKSFKDESEKLLSSVIKNWQVLKNTSADGLRENFIKRAGKLILDQDSNKHRIVVERKTQDLLLEKLPWNLNMVKLPWFEQLIFVEW
ncbi:contractile injection system tape measure protein, partial [Aquimarina litoralis]|uniref:contractile injection system tape measure protein n=1 Tax=Aquimarina litoralis TaxID=584605 RepID=UPI001C5A09C1